MTTLAQQWLEQGREEGREQGRAEGIQAGEKQILLRLLALRFGPLPDPYQTRIDAADAQTLLRWSERVLTARRLEEIFEDESA